MLALFNKAVRKLYAHLRAGKEAAIERSLPRPNSRNAPEMAPHAVEMDAELDEAAAAVREQMRARFNPEDLAQYAVAGAAEDFDAAVAGGAALKSGGIVQVKGKGGGGSDAAAGGGGKAAQLYKKEGSGGKFHKKHGHGGGRGGGGPPGKKQRK